MIRLILLFGFLSLFLSCSSENSDPTVETLVDMKLINETNQKLLDFEQVYVLGQVFSDHPQADRNLIRAALNKARTAVQILRKHGGQSIPQSQTNLAYNELNSCIFLLEKVRLLEGDQERILEVYNNIRYLHYSLAKALGQKINAWVLYKHNFGDGIEPEFRAPEGKDRFGRPVWATNFQIDFPKAKVQARDGYAWLVSKSFDISEVEQPAFRFHASYLVTSRDVQLQLFEVVERVFKVFVILDLQPGESLEDLTEDRKYRIRYNRDKIPLARDFHDEWLPFESLERFRGHSVTIAFLFDTREIEETQYYGWDIFDFEIRGAGRLRSQAYYYRPNFQAGLDEFNSNSSLFFGPEFIAKDGEAKIISNGQADSVLLSPMIYTRKMPFQDYGMTLSFVENLEASSDTTRAGLWISTDYVPGRDVDLNEESQGWELIKELGGAKDRIHEVNLSSFLQKDFFLAISFESEQAGDELSISNWTLESDGAQIYRFPFQILPKRVEAIQAFDYTDLNFTDSLDRLGEEILPVPEETNVSELNQPVAETQTVETREVLEEATEPETEEPREQAVVAEPEAEETTEATIVADLAETLDEHQSLWRPSGREPKGMRASGYGGRGNPNKIYLSRLIQRNIELSPGEKNLIRIKHRIFHYRNAFPHLNIYARPSGSTEEWKKVNLSQNDLFTVKRFSDEPEISSWGLIPFENTNVDIAFHYQASESQAPEWIIQSVEIGVEDR